VNNIKQKILFCVSLLAAVGLAGFLYWQTHAGSAPKNSTVVVQNEVAAPSDSSSSPAQISENNNLSDNASAQAEDPAIVANQSQNKNNNTDTTSTNTANVQPTSPGAAIIKKLVSFGFQVALSRTIDTIIIHSSYDAAGSNPYGVTGLIAEYKSYGVSPHYLIDRQGNIYQLVEDKNIAYQAGVGKTPDGRNNVNAFSLGIEIMNTKTDKFTDAQYAALNNLLSVLKSRYKIKYILGHDQIAPGRKDDPWNMDWSKVTK